MARLSSPFTPTMANQDFPGSQHLIARLDAAIAADCPRQITDDLRKTLCELIRSQEVRLPEEVFQANPDHYARRELHHSPELGYSVIAMTWGPGQGTPIHDHSGLWCVEGVWQGALEINQFELAEQDDDRFRFINCGAIQACAGSAGSLIPPHEYHTIRNPSSREVAVSVHIYKQMMTCCNVFVPDQQDWYRRCPKPLSLDA